MSEWYCNLVELGKIGNHPNADILDITHVYGQPVIIKRGLYKEGDKAIFLPPDSILPQDPNNPIVKDSGLSAGHRIKCKRLRGIFSNGMLVPANVCFTEEELKDIPLDTHVAERLGITKFEDDPGEMSTGRINSEDEKDPHYMPIYTDIDSLMRYKNALIPGEEVVVTLKIHGCNGRATLRENRLWVGSHKRIKKETVVDGQEKNLWWELAKRMELDSKLRKLQELLGHDQTVLFYEVYGQVQKGYHYDTNGRTTKLRIFDTFNAAKNMYNNWDDTCKIAEMLELETVPVLYRGPWNFEEIDQLCQNGLDPLGKTHIREGYVVKPTTERLAHMGRIILKRISEEYKLNKR